ncbi:MAG: DUF6777 domain-containing protein [Acidimicrobiales bacterium]|nr:DUF6777 domain-containing protein [Acidimicrobiales bacterium]
MAQPPASPPPGSGEPTAAQPPASAPPPAAPPGGAPPAAGAAAAGAGDGGGKGKGKVIAAVVVVLALIGGGVAAFALLGDDEAGASVTLEPIAETGPDPFTEPAAPEPSGTLAEFAENGSPGEPMAEGSEDGPGDYRGAEGTEVGLYGGTQREDACDVAQLTDFLMNEPAKAEAWASVIGIDPAEIPDYLRTLTPVNLGSDTRVLNHGYADGEPTPRESVLQRGTAALVDTRGVPRVKCSCGNPLAEPAVDGGESFEGDEWPSFEGATVIVVVGANVDTDAFELVDYETGELFTRQAGSGSDDPGIGGATQDQVDDGPIDFDTEYEDALEEDRTEARYTLDAPDGAIMTLEVANDPDSVRSVRTQFTSDGETFASFRTAPGAEESETIILDHEGGGQFELAFDEGPAAYTFTVGLEVQSDAGEDGDAGSDFASAFEIAAGQEVAGLLGGQDGTDHYTLEIQPGTTFTYTAATARDAVRAVRHQISLDGDRFFSERVAPGADTEFDILLGEDDEGTLEIIVDEGGADYSFTADFVSADEGGGPGDAPATLADARAIDPSGPLIGEVGTRDSADYYTFDAPGPSLAITATNSADAVRAVRVQLQDASGGSLTSFRVSPGSETSETVEVEPGTEVRLIVDEGRGAYEITFG